VHSVLGLQQSQLLCPALYSVVRVASEPLAKLI
jgi:hypothetical protein